MFVGMGFTVAEGPEVEDDWHNFGALNFRRAPPGSRHAGHVLRRPRRAREVAAAHPHLAGAVPRDERRSPRPSTRSCRAGCSATRPPTPRTCRCSIRSKASSSTRASRSATWPARIEEFIHAFLGAEYSTPAAPLVLPVHRAVGRVRHAAPRRQLARARRLRHGPPQRARACGIDPEGWSGFAFGFGIDRLALIRYGVDDIREVIVDRHPLPEPVLMKVVLLAGSASSRRSPTTPT